MVNTLLCPCPVPKCPLRGEVAHQWGKLGRKGRWEDGCGLSPGRGGRREKIQLSEKYNFPYPAKDVEVFSVLSYDTRLGVRQQKGFLMWTEWIKLSEFPKVLGQVWL